MIYVPQEYKDYKYLVSVSDNYVILTNQARANDEEIDIIYQYIDNPLTTIESTRTYGAWQTTTFERIETSQNLKDTPIWLDITRTVIIFAFAICYLVNIPTKIVKKGGIFFGS